MHSIHLPFILFTVALAVVLTLWLLPRWQAAQSNGLTAANRFDRENEARKTLAQIVGGLIVLVGLYSSVRTFDLQRQTEDLQGKSIDIQRRTESSQEQGQITERFTKAIDQLGAVIPGGALDKNGRPRINLEVRLGGIYALEEIAKDAHEKYHWTVMEVLTAYVRENAPITQGIGHSRQDRNKLRTDVQAALTVIGRREIQHDPESRYLDLSETDLRRADLNGARLQRADLSGVDLTEAHLIEADLATANLYGANLPRANLPRANLAGAFLFGADLTEAHLIGADLTEATMNEADLTEVDLYRANLTRANLTKAQLTKAFLFEANLTDAELRGADLTNAHLEKAILTGAAFFGADLTKAHLVQVHLNGANLNGVVGLTDNDLVWTYGDFSTVLPAGVHPPATWPINPNIARKGLTP